MPHTGNSVPEAGTPFGLLSASEPVLVPVVDELEWISSTNGSLPVNSVGPAQITAFG